MLRMPHGNHSDDDRRLRESIVRRAQPRAMMTSR
jgi:hypothetical protein